MAAGVAPGRITITAACAPATRAGGQPLAPTTMRSGTCTDPNLIVYHRFRLCTCATTCSSCLFADCLCHHRPRCSLFVLPASLVCGWRVTARQLRHRVIVTLHMMWALSLQGRLWRRAPTLSSVRLVLHICPSSRATTAHVPGRHHEAQQGYAPLPATIVHREGTAARRAA